MSGLDFWKQAPDLEVLRENGEARRSAVVLCKEEVGWSLQSKENSNSVQKIGNLMK